jgi:hypothetical protein
MMADIRFLADMNALSRSVPVFERAVDEDGGYKR